VEAMKLGDKRAERVIALYGTLYAVEREVATATSELRLATRQARSVPLWHELSATISALEPKAEPKSPLGKAVTYFRRQHDALHAFLTDGLLPISNAHVERLLRSVALFRKNSLFVGSLEAGNRYSVLLTLAINCALCGANPSAYFNDLFDCVADGWPAARATELMPQAWLAAQKQPEKTDA
jgi:transposase